MSAQSKVGSANFAGPRMFGEHSCVSVALPFSWMGYACFCWSTTKEFLIRIPYTRFLKTRPTRNEFKLVTRVDILTNFCFLQTILSCVLDHWPRRRRWKVRTTKVLQMQWWPFQRLLGNTVLPEMQWLGSLSSPYKKFGHQSILRLDEAIHANETATNMAIMRELGKRERSQRPRGVGEGWRCVEDRRRLREVLQSVLIERIIYRC